VLLPKQPQDCAVILPALLGGNPLCKHFCPALQMQRPGATPKMMDDRKERKYRRFRLVCPVRLKFQSGGAATEIETVSENVSICGLLVKSTALIPENTRVTFTISVPGERAAYPIRLAGLGQIVRVESGGLGASFAIAIGCDTPIIQLQKHALGEEPEILGNSSQGWRADL